jgi:hypothetical protein
LSERFEKPFVLLCEGRGDRTFFERLFEARGIPDLFSLAVPLVNGEYAGGRAAFGRYLSSVSVDETFMQNVKAVLIISDNDSDPEASFKEVQHELRSARFPVPDAVQTLARKRPLPATVVLMLPIGSPGNLENTCLPAAYSKWNLEAPLDEFVKRTPANSWQIGKQAKMRIQTILAATNEKQPDTGFSGHWKQAQEYQIPLDHACFDGIAEFLKDFPDLVSI